MGKYTKQDIFRIVEEEDVEFIRLQFSDIFGMPKNLAITASHLDEALNNECTFEASAIGGLQDGVEELYLYPDLDTFEIYPWRPQTGKVARMYCDIYTEDGKPFAGDCRQVLKRVLQEAKEMGLNFEIRPELEFFLFHTDDEGHPTTTTHEIAGFYDVAPLDLAENVRRDIILTLEDMDFEVIGSHHEISPAQHEIDFAENRADKVADDVVTFRMAVKTIAKKHGLYATFLPKPTEGINGSGMHINIFCRDQLGRNLFAGEEGDGSLSEIGQQFVAGLLAHSKSITLFTNPIVNSYKRLIPGFDAPTQVAWSDSLANRSAVISVPHRKANQARIEYRSPDGVCNPYLAFSVVLAAGLDGIRRKMQCPRKADSSLAGKSRRDLKHMHLDTLPETLGEAMDYADQDPMVRSVIGDLIYDLYKEEKLGEWRAFRSVVTNWEIQTYLGKF
ncbi:MAG: glutamine synthetase family protein [Bilifractor sp.]